jgi:CheY-like chemotaxis protein/nitrogen-specific signal transduction histidine kinase
LPSDPSKPRGALALLVDVTDRTRAGVELQRSRDAAEQASKRKTQFLSAVSHDLRTPVNALSLQAELLARLIEVRGEPDEELVQLTADIRQVAANLIELINDLLDLARFDSGMVDFQPTDFALDAFLEQTLAPLETTAAQKGLDFTWRVDRPGRVVRGDRVKLGRVLVNLVSNAVKFTDSGSVDVTARAAPDGGLVVAVRDTGSGIPEDQLERVFDEFAQLRNPERDRTKGTGLGLAICRRLVEGVGGRLTVESRLGRGSTFTARYPVDHMAADVNAPLARPAPQPGERASLAAPILLVEDDPNRRDTLARLLRHAGYVVETAADGRSALEVLGHIRPALVLLDLMMPGMEGGEVLRRIRKSPDWQDLKVVLLTGDVLSGRTADLMAMNVDGILAKPVDFNQLLDLVARFANQRPAPAGRD